MKRFAGDILVIAENEGDIKHAIDEMNEILRASEMNINDVKNKILVCTRDTKIKFEVPAYIDSRKLEKK